MLSEYIKLAIIDYRLTAESKDENIIDTVFARHLHCGVCHKLDKMDVNGDDRIMVSEMGSTIIKDNKLDIKYKHLRCISSEYWFYTVSMYPQYPYYDEIRQMLLARAEVLELILKRL